MALGWLLALQAAANAANAPAMPVIDFDLAKARPAEAEAGSCGAGSGTEIVVCGRRGPSDRFTPEQMEELARRYAEKPVRAQVGLGDGASAGVEASHGNVGSFPTNRIMVGVKIKF